MKTYRNDKESPIKVRKDGNFWITVYPNQTIELKDPRIAKRKGLSSLEETKTVKKVPKKAHEEIAERPSEDFKKELQTINGIGKKTAEDIIHAFPTKERLKEAINNNVGLPFYNDVSEQLRAEYGR